MCGATTGGLSVAGIDVSKEAVIQGRGPRPAPRAGPAPPPPPPPPPPGL